MGGPGVGFEYPPKPVAWLKRDALLFANSIGIKSDELHFLYVRRSNILHLLPRYLRVKIQLLTAHQGASP